MGHEAQQRDFGFRRDNRDYENLRLLMLDSYRFTEHVTVSGRMQKHVLQLLDSHGRGESTFVSQQRLAIECGGVSLKQVQRALEALELRGLILKQHRHCPTPENRRRVINFYTLVWSEINLLSRRQQEIRTPITPATVQPTPVSERNSNGSVMAHDRSDFSHDRSDFSHDQSDLAVLVKAPYKGHLERPPPHCAQRLPPQWEAAAAEFLRVDLRAAVPLAREAYTAGEQLQAWITRVREAIRVASLPVNATKFTRGPMPAVAWYLRNGAWPADGIVSEDEALAIKKQREEMARRKIWDELIHSLCMQGRKINKSDQEIKRVIRNAGVPDHYAASQGW